MSQPEDLFKTLISHAKEYGFIFQSSEIYDGLSAVYDYGQNGVLLKNNIRQYWWQSMVQLHENIVGIDAAIFMHPTTWKASGHVDAFSDPLIDNKDSKKRYRADVLIEEHIAKIESKIEKEVEKAAKRFENFDEKMFRSTNARVAEYQTKIDEINLRFKTALNENNLAEVKQIIVDCEIVCAVSGSKNWTDVRQFNLMFSTQLGSVSEEASTIYLRPETAQGIFVNFLNVQKTGRMKIPFGIAQTGKAFRNEIVARQFIFRMREFEQMEMQFFIRPGTQKEWYEYWKETRLKWHNALGIEAKKKRFHDHIKLAHYADAACDIEFEFPFGFKELEGIHSRTDFDLRNHEQYSGKKLQYFDPELNQNYIPYVIETSIGLDRMFLAILSSSLKEEKLEDGSDRVILSIPPQLAPVKVAVFPLMGKDGMPEKAREIMDVLKFDYSCLYEEKDNIGKRYRRQDAIGTPYCITIDQETLKDNTVTIRDRDTMKQERVAIDRLPLIIEEKVGMKPLLKKLS
ncbi:MAG TPA: glycine--tRNA ligase [Bacteroidia bacterium]|jgi:glycyl-tRNA synthetase|nr:glycine--tRNA ligase [Bacteroidia bacterium]